MHIKVVYHSSTGNTEKLAYAIGDALGVQPASLGEDTLSFSEPVDLLFIGDGIYFGKAHQKTRAFIRELDASAVKAAAVFATYGGQAKIGDEISALLREKGIRVVEKPFLCKGQAWLLLNRKHPTKAELSDAVTYAKRAVEEAGS